MNPQRWTIVGVIGALALLIGLGVTLLVTGNGSDNQSIHVLEPSSSSTASTAPSTTSTSRAPTTVAPSTTASTIRPGTSIVVPTTASPTTAPPTTATTATSSPATTTTKPATTTTTSPGHEIGITDKEIRLAVIADDTTAFDGMTAWKRVVNAAGGIAKRTIKLDLLTTNGTPDGYAEAVVQACQHDYAIVGSHSAFDSATAGLPGCGIPELAARITTPAHRNAPNTFAVIPEQAGVQNVGPFKWLASNVTGCCAQYVLVPKTDPGQTATVALANAVVKAGINEAGRVNVADNATDADYAAFVTQLSALHATLAWSGLGLDSTLALRRAGAAAPSNTVKAWLCDQRCLDAKLTAAGTTAEGQFVSSPVTPWTDNTPTIHQYNKATTAAGATPSIAGLESYAAGLLFEQTAKQLAKVNGNDGLTRAGLVTVVRATNGFTAKGILGATDIGKQLPTGCFALVRVHNGKFERAFPTVAGQLSCGAQNLQP